MTVLENNNISEWSWGFCDSSIFCFIGNFDFLNRKKKHMFIEHMLDKEKRAHLSNDFRVD